ncbi:MAG: 3-phosphoshikimate 1-carboxyvinyltransferase, partial [Candidatus Omnitrophica bacterium]|nr:3-phosphoshikimate 1-carboxyvinyltransferase [Candidatus Omnitrophota bacterium]
ISHRAVMFGALADGTSSYTHFLEAEDCLHTLMAFQAMGVRAEHTRGTGAITIYGKGLRSLTAPAGEIYLGNSGTSMRLLMGILAGQRFECVLSGDPSLSSRPMKRVTQPLKLMGAQIKGRDNGNFAPLTIRGGRLKAIEFENVLASAQVKSALLFAGLYAEGVTQVIEPRTSRDHTEKLLKAAGANFQQEGNVLKIQATDSLKPLSFVIPGDFSAAAFFIGAAAMIPGSSLTVENVCLNPLRTGMLEVLKRMGAAIEVQEQTAFPEPCGRINVEGRRLTGTRITASEIPGLIDELPMIMTLMALCEGESLISGAEELRVKETDRILSMVTNLNILGAKLKELPDGCMIQGVEKLQGGRVQSFGDHRTAMCMAIASLISRGEIHIEDIDCVSTSFPTFFSEFERLRA